MQLALAMSIAPFPHRYAVVLDNDVLTAGARQMIRVGAPVEFGGTDDVWSPEHLLVASALTCLKTTFDAYARREQLVIHRWRGTATGLLQKGPEGPVFSTIDLAVEIVTAVGEEGRAESVLAGAAIKCIVSRALSAPVHVTSSVTAAPGRAAD